MLLQEEEDEISKSRNVEWVEGGDVQQPSHQLCIPTSHGGQERWYAYIYLMSRLH